MAVQNNYNNYIKRQRTNNTSTDQFRQKIANSLGGVSTNTTQNTKPVTLGVTPTGKTNTTTSKTVGVGGYGRDSKPYSMSQNVINPQSNSNALQSKIQGEKTISAPATQSTIDIEPNQVPTTPQQVNEIPQNINPQENVPTNENTDGVGMMSLEDVNNAYNNTDIQEVNNLANTPEVRQQAYANGKTPQEIAQELLQMQKEQLQKDWELKRQELELQRNQTQQSYEQSVKDAGNSYDQTVDKLNDARYNEMQDLAVSGQKRGIQYSPQQLGLENVANINHNKNLAEASKTRNELLNNLSIELGKAMQNINMGLQGATNNYNSAVSNLMSDYNKQLMDWAYNDEKIESDRNWQQQVTESDRAWQEAQKEKDNAFEKEMQELTQKWQAEQNALDREVYGKSSGGYSGRSGYSRGNYYSRGYSGYSGYSPRSWSYGNGYSNGGYGNDLDLTSTEGMEAFGNTLKQYSTDLYNALDVGGMEDLNDRGNVYIDEIDKYLDYAKENGASKQAINELEKTREVALKHMFNKSYARDTNSEYKIGDTIYRPSTPVRNEYINKVKSTKQLDRANFYSRVGRTEKDREQAKVNASFLKNSGQGRTIEDLKKYASKNNSNTKQNTVANKVNSANKDSKSKTPSKVVTNVKKSASNVKQSTAKSKENLKKNVVNKSVKTNSKNVVNVKQSALQKSFSNLKKNISNMFKKKKK